MLMKTTRLTLVDQVILQMESLIESGEWPVGKKIPSEPELVEELQVSRNTLREGVKALCHSGVLSTKQGDGTYVTSSSMLGAALQKQIQKSSLLHTLEVRNALEQEAAKLSAERRTEEDLEKILHYQKACNSFAGARDIESYVAADMSLHRAIVESTSNQMLIDMYGHITESIRESIINFLRRQLTKDFPQDAHHGLVEAIIAQNTQAAAHDVMQFFEQLKREIEEEEH